jgi:23S rRNA G2445 N2-methylase RlmL
VLRKRCQGHAVYLFSGNPRLEAEIELKPEAAIPLFNGRIPCRLLKYRVG